MSGFEPAHYRKVGGASAKGTARMAGVFRGVAIFMATLVLLALDLMLSVSLMISQSAGERLPDGSWDRFLYAVFGIGSDLSFFGKVIPWLFSIGTTGLIYALWNPPKSVKKTWITYVGYAMAIMDTLTDVGGLNAFLTGDPAAGTQIFPGGMPTMYLIYDAFVAVLCIAQEPILKLLLGQQQARANAPTDDPGAPIERGFLNLSGAAFSLTSAASMFVGSIGLLLMDVVLTPQIPQATPIATYFLWGLSFAIFAVQMAGWRYLRRIRDVGESLKQQNQRAKMIIGGVAVFAALDTYLDLKGYNSALYGTEDLLISEPTPVWWLTSAMLFILTLFGEPLNDALFGGLWENFRGGGGGTAVTVRPATPSAPTPPPGAGLGGYTTGTPPGPVLPKPPSPPAPGGPAPGAPPAMPWLPGGKPPGSS